MVLLVLDIEVDAALFLDGGSTDVCFLSLFNTTHEASSDAGSPSTAGVDDTWDTGGRPFGGEIRGVALVRAELGLTASGCDTGRCGLERYGSAGWGGGQVGDPETVGEESDCSSLSEWSVLTARIG